MRPYSRYTCHRSTTDAVTFDTTDAQTVRPYSRYSSRCSTTDAVTFDTTDAVAFDTTDAQTVRPYSRYSSKLSHVSLGHNGRTDRASLQPLLVRAFLLFATRSVC